MLELAAVTGKDVLYDIGCGDGRIVITAARRYGIRGVGIDIDQAMIEESERNAAAAGVNDKVRFLGMDATKADISEATVVSLYLLPESNALMRPILETQLRPKSRVVCHNYAMPGWESKQSGSRRSRTRKARTTTSICTSAERDRPFGGKKGPSPDSGKSLSPALARDMPLAPRPPGEREADSWERTGQKHGVATRSRASARYLKQLLS